MTDIGIQRPWQFCVNQKVGPSPTAGVWPPQYLTPSTGKNTILHVKNTLKGAGSWTDLEGAATTSTGNWTVVSSCDGAGGAGSFGNNDGVDRWADATDIVAGAAANPRSWIVLAQPGISPNYELCIEFNSAGTYDVATIVVSRNQRFGAIGGGVDGAANARPTALDEVVLVSSAAYGGVAYFSTQRVHVMKSADGAATRVLFTRGGFTGGLWMLEAPTAVDESWEYPAIGAVIALSAVNITSSTVVGTNLYNTANFKGLSKYPGGAAFAAQLSNPASQTDFSFEASYVPNEIGGNPMFYPASLLVASSTTTIGYRGTYGTLVDCYFPPDSAPDGMTYPQDGSRQWVQVGRLVMPWNKSANIWY